MFNNKKDKEVSEEIRYEDIFYITNAPKDYSINDDDLITMDIRNTTRLLSNLKLEDLDIEKNEVPIAPVDPRYTIEQVKEDSYIPNGEIMEKYEKRFFDFF